MDLYQQARHHDSPRMTNATNYYRQGGMHAGIP